MSDVQISVPGGMVCVTTYGTLRAEMVNAWGNLREHFVRSNLNAVFTFVPGSLVDRARNQAVVQFLNHQPALGWLCFIDGDAVFNQDALHHLLAFAYGDGRYADVVGGYCVLRGEPYLPTIDTGTGTWESTLPGQGPIEVMRTGSAFIVLKRHVFENVAGPWYGTRNPMRPIDALAEVDNFAHTRFDGRNPLADTPEWQSLLQCAKDDASSRQRHDPSAFVGEDSNWCDTLRFHGYRIFVHTDVEVSHADMTVRTAADHRECLKKMDGMNGTMVGLQ